MADESMLRNLAAQARAIWPQEEPLLERYALGAEPRIVDVGCGSGEITSRLAIRYPDAHVVGVDILEAPLAFARQKHANLGPRVRFEQGDAFELRFADAEFDLVVCRHMTQAVPEPAKILRELQRTCKPGGWIHVVSEDYGMLHFPEGQADPDRLWQHGVALLARATSTDERIGRKTWSLMRALGLVELRVDYAVVDTVRVPRETFAEIIRAWRDGYSRAIEERASFGPGEVRALFDSAISSILDPESYAVWHVPVVSGQRPLR